MIKNVTAVGEISDKVKYNLKIADLVVFIQNNENKHKPDHLYNLHTQHKHCVKVSISAPDYLERDIKKIINASNLEEYRVYITGNSVDNFVMSESNIEQCTKNICDIIASCFAETEKKISFIIASCENGPDLLAARYMYSKGYIISINASKKFKLTKLGVTYENTREQIENYITNKK